MTMTMKPSIQHSVTWRVGAVGVLAGLGLAVAALSFAGVTTLGGHRTVSDVVPAPVPTSIVVVQVPADAPPVTAAPPVTEVVPPTAPPVEQRVSNLEIRVDRLEATTTTVAAEAAPVAADPAPAAPPTTEQPTPTTTWSPN